VAAYAFNEGTGTTVADSSGNRFRVPFITQLGLRAANTAMPWYSTDRMPW
jgi:hypothetical protein